MSFVRAFGSFGLSKVFSTLIIFVIGVITARVLEPEGRGIYALFFMLVGLLGHFFAFGIPQANIFFLNKSKETVGVLTGANIIFIGFSALSSAFVLFGIYFFEIANFFSSYNSFWWLPLLWWTSLITLVEISFGGLILGKHYYKLYSWNLIIQSVILLIATLLIFIFGQQILVAVLLRSLGASIFTLWVVAIFWFHTKEIVFRFSREIFAKKLRFGLKNWIQNLIGLFNYRGNFILLAIFSEPEAIGFFSVALLFSEAIRFFPDTVGTLLLPELVGMKKTSSADLFAARVFRLALAFSVIAAVVLFILTPVILPIIFGSSYVDGVEVAQILLFGSVFGVIYQILTRYFTSINKQEISIFSGATSLIFLIGFSWMLIPKFGAEGAAISFTISSFLSATIMITAFKLNSQIPFREALILKMNDVIECWMAIKTITNIRRK